MDLPDSNNFVEISRKEVVGKDSGEVQREFTQIQRGYYYENDKGDTLPRFAKGGATWPPSVTNDIITALADTFTDEEAKEYGWE